MPFPRRRVLRGEAVAAARGNQMVQGQRTGVVTVVL